jgi:type II secretory ATPase GspE/PulE/Tfp pilus assembly ATPase PilB-like protein
MGVEPFLVASSVEGVLAQRLVRKVCKACAAPYTPDPADLPRSLNLEPGTTLVRGGGCRDCRHTGYRGRLGVYELLSMSDDIREMVMTHVNSPTIVAKAVAAGDLLLLKQDGLSKARAGITTIEEVMRALSA